MLCLKCHKIDRSQSDCLKCHKEVAASEYLHGPLGSGECIACHDPESVPSKFTARFGGEGELCFGCHQESKNKYSNNRFLHGPVGVNQCTVCHNPHSSSFKYQLVAAERDICYLCHESYISSLAGRTDIVRRPQVSSKICKNNHKSSNQRTSCKRQTGPASTGKGIKLPQLPQSPLSRFPISFFGRTVFVLCQMPQALETLHNQFRLKPQRCPSDNYFNLKYAKDIST